MEIIKYINNMMDMEHIMNYGWKKEEGVIKMCNMGCMTKTRKVNLEKEYMGCRHKLHQMVQEATLNPSDLTKRKVFSKPSEQGEVG